jgi:hypothetical protein
VCAFTRDNVIAHHLFDMLQHHTEVEEVDVGVRLGVRLGVCLGVCGEENWQIVEGWGMHNSLGGNLSGVRSVEKWPMSHQEMLQ